MKKFLQENLFGKLLPDIKRNWVDINRKENTMSVNLLVLYEIADKASKVKSKKSYKEFERWVRNLISTYHDAAIERVASIHLFRLREQFSF